MTVIDDIVEKMAKQYNLPVKFIYDLFELERDRVSQLRRRNITADIRELLRCDYWEAWKDK